ncbi:membrane-spanning 4-domains subfamily A member 15-like [Gracilinanus agilis]|uniref:membrane-spanning 4-domains subfamily A member 15-like n=1 Tax=Gracilinanus agilis TaxID=191870 RepID=UPI001CFEFDCD|nr:membrane-spanning 4-domains subfamily A member 15-like [Gracilinanus agilis]
MTSAPATNGVFVVIPPNNASGIRPGPAMLPRTLCQSPGALQFEETPLGAQPSGSVPHQRLPPAETFLNGEPKALGTVQILIGLIYISFGSVLLMFRRGYIGMLFIDGGIPFWGGVCRSMVFLPNAFSTDFNIPSPAATPPPAYDNVAYTSKETSE